MLNNTTLKLHAKTKPCYFSCQASKQKYVFIIREIMPLTKLSGMPQSFNQSTFSYLGPLRFFLIFCHISLSLQNVFVPSDFSAKLWRLFSSLHFFHMLHPHHPPEFDTNNIWRGTKWRSWQRPCVRLRLKCDGTRAETRFRLSPKRTSPFKSAGASVQSTTGSRGMRISDSNAGYTMFRGSVKSTGYPLHSPVSPSIPLPYVTVCHQVSTGVYNVGGNMHRGS